MLLQAAPRAGHLPRPLLLQLTVGAYVSCRGGVRVLLSGWLVACV